MFTFSLTSFLAPYERAANQTYSELSLGTSKPLKASRSKRVRHEKFYKHSLIGLFGHISDKYLIKRKDGRFYIAHFSGEESLIPNHVDNYKTYRKCVKNGTWLETTMEEELAAQSSQEPRK